MAKSATVAEPSQGTEAQDRPLLDTHNVTLKKLVARGKEQGYVTYEELNAAVPQEQVSSEQIEDVMTMLSEMGINLIDGEESEDTEAGGARKSEKAVVEKKANEEYERTDDPVRMYLREMGSVELLSREGEIAIAKRIEAGRGAMIAGLCESPLTFQAIIIWRDELNEGRILLRDIIDLDATYAGPDAKKVPEVPGAGEGADGEGAEGEGKGEGEAAEETGQRQDG